MAWIKKLKTGFGRQDLGFVARVTHEDTDGRLPRENDFVCHHEASQACSSSFRCMYVMVMFLTASKAGVEIVRVVRTRKTSIDKHRRNANPRVSCAKSAMYQQTVHFCMSVSRSVSVSGSVSDVSVSGLCL